MNKLGISSLELTLSGYNLLTFSSLKHIDPETNPDRFGDYPLVKLYSLGLNVNFKITTDMHFVYKIIACIIACIITMSCSEISFGDDFLGNNPKVRELQQKRCFLRKQALK